MKRVERAARVRDLILAIPRDQWEWRDVGGVRFLEIHRPAWSASLLTRFAGQRPRPAAGTYQEALILAAVPPDLPNLLDVWVKPEGKVLSVEWDEDSVRLISMRRGDWEAELFGLPAWKPCPPADRT